MSAQEHLPSLETELRAAVERSAGTGPCSLLFSGGVDSSFLAFLARAHHPSLVSVGVAGSIDLRVAREAAAMLDVPVAVRELTPAAVAAACERWAAELSGADTTSRAVTVGLALALEAAPSTRVLCGQGADELFLGYAHFRGLDAAAAERRRRADLARLTLKDWPRIVEIARRLDREIAAPYLDPQFSAAVDRLPIERHLSDGPPGKPVLRALAAAAGLPIKLAERPKKAFQFGSGIGRVLRDLDRVGPSPRVVI